ncbi:MAG: LacI family DNA-binding transcriptional regulator [Caldilineaceae bacterium]|nr:LacI family DNA-binding transcriptional regulator [Caldilineaceae bacterium]
MSRRKITSHDVATRAGVSRTTVSYVLNKVETANISEQTRQRVLDAADALGYVPNAAAQMLAGHRSHIIGLVFPRLHSHLSTHLFLLQILEGIMAVVEQQGMRLLIDSVESSHERAYLDLAHAKRIDGLILIDVPGGDRGLQRLAHDQFPIVTLGYSHPSLCSVDVDNAKGAQLAVEHLLAQGHTRIGCITNSPTTVAPNLRLVGYQRALQQAALPFDGDLLVDGDYHPESGFVAMQQLLALPQRPTAVFVASDVVAFGALAAIQAQGLSIPQDIAVVGFDDVPLARYATPSLTTVRMPTVEMGQRAAELLYAQILHQPVESQVLLTTELVVRASSVVQQ